MNDNKSNLSIQDLLERTKILQEEIKAPNANEKEIAFELDLIREQIAELLNIPNE